jgi:hypothetical protein
LHLAMGCYRSHFSEIIDTILKAEPDAPKMLRKDGNTPLHVGIRNSMPLEKLSKVTLAHPDAATLINSGELSIRITTGTTTGSPYFEENVLLYIY